MKLISVQSRGNRLVRIIVKKLGFHIIFIVWGKVVACSKEWGLTIRGELLGGYSELEIALKAAETWLKGATI